MKELKEILNVTSSERRGIAVLVIVIVVLVVIRFILPQIIKSDEKINYSIETLEAPRQDTVKQVILSEEAEPLIEEAESVVLKEINPNTAHVEEFIACGFSEAVANNIIKYRLKGGVFKKAEDLYKIYNIDSQLVSSLIPLIVIEETVLRNSKKETRLPKRSINVNLADEKQLVEVPYIDEALAIRIIKYRSLLGGFYSLNQLKEVYGINDFLYKNVEPYLSLSPGSISKIRLNSGTFADMIRHPYLKSYHVKSILGYRELMGDFTEESQLLSNHILDEDLFNKIKPYLAVN